MLEVGRIVRPHGLTGEVVVEFVTNRPERTRPGAVLTAPGGELSVVRARPFGGRWLVVFEGICSREDAERLKGQPLEAPALSDPGALWVHELIGARVTTSAGEVLGNVASVVANPASDLLELDRGHLIPVRFVVRVGPGEVVVEPPPGLVAEVD